MFNDPYDPYRCYMLVCWPRPIDPQNISAGDEAVGSELYNTLSSNKGVINLLYTNNQFSVYKEQLLSPE